MVVQQAGRGQRVHELGAAQNINGARKTEKKPRANTTDAVETARADSSEKLGEPSKARVAKSNGKRLRGATVDMPPARDMATAMQPVLARLPGDIKTRMLSVLANHPHGAEKLALMGAEPALIAAATEHSGPASKMPALEQALVKLPPMSAAEREVFEDTIAKPPTNVRSRADLAALQKAYAQVAPIKVGYPEEQVYERGLGDAMNAGRTDLARECAMVSARRGHYYASSAAFYLQYHGDPRGALALAYIALAEFFNGTDPHPNALTHPMRVIAEAGGADGRAAVIAFAKEIITEGKNERAIEDCLRILIKLGDVVESRPSSAGDMHRYSVANPEVVGLIRASLPHCRHPATIIEACHAIGEPERLLALAVNVAKAGHDGSDYAMAAYNPAAVFNELSQPSEADLLRRSSRAAGASDAAISALEAERGIVQMLTMKHDDLGMRRPAHETAYYEAVKARNAPRLIAASEQAVAAGSPDYAYNALIAAALVRELF